MTDTMDDAIFYADGEDPPSSPFIDEVTQTMHNKENISPQKNHISPIKQRSPFKPPPIKPRPTPRMEERALRDNQGLTRAIQIMEDGIEESGIYYDVEDITTWSRTETPEDQDMDDTCFSTFSAVPNADMTLFARLGERDNDIKNSPTKPTASVGDSTAAPTPRQIEPSTPGTVLRQQQLDSSPAVSPTPRQNRSSDEETTNLLDFTEQFNAITAGGTSPSKTRQRMSPIKFRSQRDLSALRAGRSSPTKQSYPPATPAEQKYLANLLDFDIPPAPTPRSVPSITPRELESLKSNYLSQISSMKATLSGREAEVASLKEAVEDAERRVGEALESFREEKGKRETLEEEKKDLEKRGQEMEGVLRDVKDQIIRTESESRKMVHKAEENDRKCKEAELKVADLENQIADLSQAAALTSSANTTSNGGDGKSSPASARTREIEAAVEIAARDLHAMYKRKHESKVAALRKSYEGRWERKTKELETKIEELNKENEELRIGKDATMSGVIPSQVDLLAKHEKEVEEQRSKIDKLTEDVDGLKINNERLVRELEKERLEKGDLVAAVEEMLALNTIGGDTSANGAAENLRSSISRMPSSSSVSGLKNPGFSSSIGYGESRIGRAPSAGKESGAPRSRSGSGLAQPRSGIMSSIERMGRVGSGRSD